jgi:hypothetical protein
MKEKHPSNFKSDHRWVAKHAICSTKTLEKKTTGEHDNHGTP